MEIWKQITKAPNYEVSTMGRIRRAATGRHTRIGLIRKPWRKQNGKYLLVTLNHRDDSKKSFSVHRLVAEAFLGPSELQVNHKNGDHADNRISNLEYVDGAANRAHAMNVLDAYAKGSKHPNAKLTEESVTNIKAMIRQGLSDRFIADVVGCTSTNIYYIRKGRAWTHVK